MELLTREGRAPNAAIAAAARTGQANNIAGTMFSDVSKLRSNGALASSALFDGLEAEPECDAEDDEPALPPVVDCVTVLDDEQDARL
jgi:hypothetical protein